MINLAIALPAYGSQLDIGHAAMWLGLGAALGVTQDKFKLVSFTECHINGIDLARNSLVYSALQTEASWCLMVDSDTYYRTISNDGSCEAAGDGGVDILQMIRDADRGQYVVNDFLANIPMPSDTTGVGLVGAPVRGRGGKQDFCVHSVSDDDQKPMTLEELQGKIQPVGRIGGAFIAVHLAWLREHWPEPPWFEMQFDYKSGKPRCARGEDYAICDGIYQRGGVVLCDGRLIPSHVDRRRLVGEHL